MDWLILNGVEYRPGVVATLTAQDLHTLELVQRYAPLRTRFASIGMRSGRSIDRLVLETAPKISAIEALWDTQIPYAFSRWVREEWQLTVP